MAKLDIDQELIRDLAALLEETGLNEIELEDDGKRLRVVRAAPTPNVVAAPAPALAAAPAAQANSGPANPADHPGAVLSPMVGTVYVAPEPGQPPFVKVGDVVSAGQPLVIVEAMKTMNQIPAPKAGKVLEILISDADPVEYGDPLMIIE
ncbi:MAG: acetyl-CoA carboxylase biotin carboxyl carrier protein [Sphingomonadales bacterium]